MGAVAVAIAVAAAPSALAAPVTDFVISSNRDVEQIDGHVKSYDTTTGVFTTGPQPMIDGVDNRPHKEIAGAVQSTAMDRTYVIRARLPADQAPQVGRTYSADEGNAGSSGLSLWLRNVDCPVTAGSFTLNQYAEQADGTPTTIDLSFTGTCEAADRLPATFTGRYRLNAAGPPPAAAPRDTTRPVLSGVKLGRSAFSARRGTTLRFRLSEAARTTLTVQRRTSGRRVGRRCVRARASNRGRRGCHRYVTLRGARTVAGRALRNSVPLPGRVGRRTLDPGRYRLVLRAVDAAGNRSTTRHAPFRVTRR